MKNSPLRACLLVLSMVTLAGLLFMVFSRPLAAHDVTYEYLRATVLEVNDIQRAEHIEQEVKAEIRRGTRAGNTISFVNHYSKDIPGLYYLSAGSSIIVGVQSVDAEQRSVFLQDIARDESMVLLAIVFAALLLIIGRTQGLKTIVTLVVTAVALVFVLLPAILRGHDPIVASAVTAGAIALVTLLVVGGWNLKSLSAILGTLGGVVVAGILTLWFGSVLELTGFTSEEAHMLRIYGGITDLQGVLFGGIILGSLGAVTDVGMSIASAALEIKQANPGIARSRLFRSAMNVGRDIMGTMANTLILAYVGTTMPLLLLVLHQETDWLVISNMNIIAAEMLRGMAGSIGLVVSIPATAFVAAGILSAKHAEK